MPAENSACVFLFCSNRKARKSLSHGNASLRHCSELPGLAWVGWGRTLCTSSAPRGPASLISGPRCSAQLGVDSDKRYAGTTLQHLASHPCHVSLASCPPGTQYPEPTHMPPRSVERSHGGWYPVDIRFPSLPRMTVIS